MRTGRTGALCAVALLTACHGDSRQAPAASPTPHRSAPVAAKRGPTPDELTVGMVEAVTVGKSTVPVTVKFELGSRPMVAQPLDIVVAVMPQVAADPVVLTVSGSDGLQMPAVARIEIPAVEPTQVYRHTLNILPTAEGVQLVNLSVSLQHDEITETREFALPVIVTPAAAAAAAAAPGPGGKH